MEQKKKELLTLEQKFEKYNGRLFTVRLNSTVKGVQSCYIKCEIMGYAKSSKHNLIGKLKGNLGVTAHFLKVGINDVIPNHKEGNNYIYLNLSRIERYPEVKKVVNKKDRKDEVTLSELEF